ncbi:hypothetical protein [Bartonella tamiae]|uniref:hypothetical protein n=1 Tax=Bartonella tamiae TaxID=373638 RepID=UPI00026E73E1|nr:hypothetical protein [Bartonella tamiae]EJF93765.1 hypothetical protein MEG_01189 [Bartonella tamiae Th307]
MISSVLLLSNCASTNVPLSQPIQNQYVGHSIKDVELKLGIPDSISNTQDGTVYSWNRSDTRWVTLASSQKIAGTRMVNGHNVASIVNGPPIQTMQTVSCSVSVTTDKQGKVIALTQTSSGISCSDIIYKLSQ